jgi:rhamnose transport system ATP-binding protein
LVGSGRTELAQTLFGILPADSGHIVLEGIERVIDCPQDAITHGIVYVPEDRARHGVILEMPVVQNITMAIHRRIFPRGWLRPAAELDCAADYIHSLNIKPAAAGAPAWSLSGGNQQKISVARWLAARPKVLILDEPTQGVDVGAKSEIHGIIRSLAKQGLAVLLISSDLPELLALSDRIGVMRSGRLTTQFPGGTAAQQIMTAAFGPGELP